MVSTHFTLPENITPISTEADPLKLAGDLRTLCKKALDMGAAGAAVLSPGDLCFSDGKILEKMMQTDFPSIHWPLDYPGDDLKNALFEYKKGIFVYNRPYPDMPDYGGGPIESPEHIAAYRKIHEIVSALEAAAFYLGYYLAMGFAAGNCRSIFCAVETQCNAAGRGKGCIAPYKGRPSLTAAGIDTRETARKVHLSHLNTERLFLSGLVMVA